MQLNTRFELRQVEEVSSINREVVDLLAADGTLHRGLFGVDGVGGTLNFNDGAALAHGELEVSGSRLNNLNGDGFNHRLESRRLDANDVIGRE